MYRQVGNLKLDARDIAVRGLLVRHLCCPNACRQALAFTWLYIPEISKDTHISLMSQYHPCYKANDHPTINRRLAKPEYDEVIQYAEASGLENCFIQELSSSDDLSRISNVKDHLINSLIIIDKVGLNMYSSLNRSLIIHLLCGRDST